MVLPLELLMEEAEMKTTRSPREGGSNRTAGANVFCIISAGMEPGHLITWPKITSYVEVGMQIFKLKKKEKPPSTKGLSLGEHKGNFTTGCHRHGPATHTQRTAGCPPGAATWACTMATPVLRTPGSAPAEPIPRGQQGAIGAMLQQPLRTTGSKLLHQYSGCTT